MSADDSDEYSYKLYTSCPSFCLLLYFIWIENCDVSHADLIIEGFRIAKHQKLRFLLMDTRPILFNYKTVCRVKSNKVSSIASSVGVSIYPMTLKFSYLVCSLSRSQWGLIDQPLAFNLSFTTTLAFVSFGEEIMFVDEILCEPQYLLKAFSGPCSSTLRNTTSIHLRGKYIQSEGLHTRNSVPREIQINAGHFYLYKFLFHLYNQHVSRFDILRRFHKHLTRGFQPFLSTSLQHDHHDRSIYIIQLEKFLLGRFIKGQQL